MNPSNHVSAINDVVISNAFWLTIFLVCIGFFHSEIKGLLSSLSSVSVTGSHFELGDKKLTLKSYAMLSFCWISCPIPPTLSNCRNCSRK